MRDIRVLLGTIENGGVVTFPDGTVAKTADEVKAAHDRLSPLNGDKETDGNRSGLSAATATEPAQAKTGDKPTGEKADASTEGGRKQGR